MQTVYVDLYFFINFSMDILCLFLTSKLLSEKLSLSRALLAAAFGGLYANLSLFVGVGGFLGFLFDVISLFLLCIIAFGQRMRLKRMPLYILVFAAISATLGGIMTALYYTLNRTGIFDFLREGDGDGISVWIFAFLAAVSAVITLLGGRGATRKMSASDVRLEITLGGRTVPLHGMIDSGNLLRDPISGKPCIVVDARRLRPILPPELRDGKNMTAGLSALRGDVRKKVVLIPVATATGERMLVGLRAERVRISAEGREKYADAIIALSDIEVEALVPSCLLI